MLAQPCHVLSQSFFPSFALRGGGFFFVLTDRSSVGSQQSIVNAGICPIRSPLFLSIFLKIGEGGGRGILTVASHIILERLMVNSNTVKIFILGRNKTGTPQKIVDCSSFVPYQHCFGGGIRALSKKNEECDDFFFFLPKDALCTWVGWEWG